MEIKIRLQRNDRGGYTYKIDFDTHVQIGRAKNTISLLAVLDEHLYAPLFEKDEYELTMDQIEEAYEC